jgi:tRNA(Ile)-lysidine synthase
VLLHALHALGAPRLRAVHVDHGLQAVSAAWSQHCREICSALCVPIALERIEVTREEEESTEAAARRLRYARLAAHLEPDDILLTAHHEDDQAETVLLALMRGTGVHGMAAMPDIVSFGPGKHARPLLGFSRAALAAYAAMQKLEWVEDHSNRDERMARNFLRARALPLLAGRWPAASRALARAASNSADTMALVDEVAERDFSACSADGNQLSLTSLRTLSAPRQRNLVRYWICHHGFRAPSTQHLQLILEQVEHPSQTGHACVDWQGVEVRRYRDTLTVRARNVVARDAIALSWQPPHTLNIPGTNWRLSAIAAQGTGLSQAKLARAALTVKFRQGGERCQLAGHAHRSVLKKLLQDAGVPPWERARIPLVFADDQLAAIGDRWVCAPFAAESNEPAWKIVLDIS